MLAWVLYFCCGT